MIVSCALIESSPGCEESSIAHSMCPRVLPRHLESLHCPNVDNENLQITRGHITVHKIWLQLWLKTHWVNGDLIIEALHRVISLVFF